MVFPDCMIDLETTGLAPDHAAIIQIAAVRFNYDQGTIGPTFEACLTVPPGRFWDEDTRGWWMNQKEEILVDILTRAEDAETVWKRFADWLVETSPAAHSNRLWAKPSHFEWPLLESYGRQFGRRLPFHYRDVVDLNSFTRGMERNPGANPLDKKVEFDGNAHNALDDTFHQVKVALMAQSLIQ